MPPLISARLATFISCAAPYSTIGFRGEFFLRCPPSKAFLWIAIDHFHTERSGGVAAMVCDTTGNSATGVLRHLSRDRGGTLVGSLRFCMSFLGEGKQGLDGSARCGKTL